MRPFCLALTVSLVTIAAGFKPVQRAEGNPIESTEFCENFPKHPMCEASGQQMEKRKSAYMRFGRSDGGADAEKWNGASATRFGNVEAEEPMEKRKSAYMRFGKRKSAYMRFGKRGFESFGDSGMELPEKRKSAYMRFGKRSDDVEAVAPFEMEKRKSAYMRFGR